MVSIDYLRRSPEIDGAAIVEHVSYEGQGPMILESLVFGEGKRVLLPLTEDCNGVRRLGWKPLFAHFLDGSYPLTVPAARVHHSLAHSIVDQVCLIGYGQAVKFVASHGIESASSNEATTTYGIVHD